MPYEQSTRTLIATFRDYSTAQQAANELRSSGISSDAIHVDSNQKTAGAGSGGYQADNSERGEHEGGFSGWWNSLFGSGHDSDDEERSSYEGALSSGNAVLRATVPEAQVEMASDILNQYGTVDVQGRQTGTSTGTAQTAQTQTTGSGPIQLVEEELQVGKRAVQRGGVRIYSHMVSQPVEEQVRLREEHVNVQRRPVNREISPEEVSALRDQTIEVKEMAEEAVIGKRARVREEVVIGKEATERTETIRDTVRHTEVEVEQLGGARNAESQPGYDYGYRTAADARYRGRSWSEVENDVRADYESSNPGSKWEQVKESVREGWDKVTGQR